MVHINKPRRAPQQRPEEEEVRGRYRVKAPHAILGVKPGEVSEMVLAKDHEKRLLDMGAIEPAPEPFTAPVSSALKSKSKNRPEKAVTTEQE